MSFREWLKKYRGKKSVRQLAKESGVSASYISMIESGQLARNPSPEVISKLESALDLPTGQLAMHSPTGSTISLMKICAVPDQARIMNELMAEFIKDPKKLDKALKVVKQ